MPKKSIDLHVDGFLLRYLDTVDVEGINMLAFFKYEQLWINVFCNEMEN